MLIKVIARVMGISKNTVRAALHADGPPKYERPLRGSVVEEVEPRIRELLQAWPTMPATGGARIGVATSVDGRDQVVGPFATPSARAPR
jgi:transposase